MSAASSEYRRILIALVLVAVASVGAFALLYLEGQQRASQMESTPEAEADPDLIEAQATGSKVELKIFFPVAASPLSDGPLLRTEQRSLFQSDDPVVMARQIISEVLRGSSNSLNVFAPSSRLRQIYLMENGTAVVDLSAETAQQLPGGVLEEYWALRSISRSLTANIESVKRVKFLVGGQDRPTFAGHVSIREPFM